eukprot:g25002.t1
MWRLLPLGVAALHDVLELDDAQGVQEGTLGNSPAFHALQISVSSTLSDDQHFRGQGSYETCVARCGGGCQPGFPPAADFFHEGVRGPNENDWAVWILSLHNLQHQLSTLPWAQGSGEFDSPEFRRSSNAFVTVQTMIHDRKLYDPVRNTYTAVAYLNDLKDRFGGVDQVLLWAGYPNLGVDTRSNLDLMDSLPGGLHSAVDAFRQANPKLLIQPLSGRPWDIATNGLGQHDPSRYADLMARAGADGLNLDTMDSLGPFVVPPSQSKPEMPVTEFFAAARQERELLKRAMLILRHFGHFLSDPGVAWLPFYPVQKLTSKGENVYVSKFVGSDRELFLIINTGLQTADAQAYRGDDVHLERVNTCLVKSCNERIHRAQTAQLHLSVEGGGIGAILKEKPLSSFADKVSLAKQTYHPGDGGAGTLSNTGGMVVVNGSAAFEFRVVGSEIEDTYRGGQNFVKLGVDVQFPWEDEAVKYHVAHNVSIKDLLVDKFPVTNEMFAAFLKETSYVPGDKGNFLRHWNCETCSASSMPASIAKQPVVFAPSPEPI